MELKYAVALMHGDDEKILGLFDTREEADAFGSTHVFPHEEGLEFCYSALFFGTTPAGNSQSIHSYYNM